MTCTRCCWAGASTRPHRRAPRAPRRPASPRTRSQTHRRSPSTNVCYSRVNGATRSRWRRLGVCGRTRCSSRDTWASGTSRRPRRRWRGRRAPQGRRCIPWRSCSRACPRIWWVVRVVVTLVGTPVGTRGPGASATRSPDWSVPTTLQALETSRHPAATYGRCCRGGGKTW